MVPSFKKKNKQGNPLEAHRSSELPVEMVTGYTRSSLYTDVKIFHEIWWFWNTLRVSNIANENPPQKYGKYMENISQKWTFNGILSFFYRGGICQQAMFHFTPESSSTAEETPSRYSKDCLGAEAGIPGFSSMKYSHYIRTIIIVIINYM
jgi:hypothetical protein